jgi:WD40 repeat protein
VQLRTYLDPTASIVVSSSTNKSVSIYEAASGKPIARCFSGEITTAMCLSQNMRQLITASDHGVIYVWRLPSVLADQLNKIKCNSHTIDDDFNFDMPESGCEPDQLGNESKQKGSANDVTDVLA